MLLLGLLLFPATGRAQHWREITPADGVAPSPRTHAAAIYDEAAHRVVIFGGRGEDGALNDVWALDLGTERWTALTPMAEPAPPPRSTPAGVM